LVWGFWGATFSLFLEAFLGTKKSPFLTPLAAPNQQENYHCSPKTGSRSQSEKKTILKHFLKGFLEGKSLV